MNNDLEGILLSFVGLERNQRKLKLKKINHLATSLVYPSVNANPDFSATRVASASKLTSANRSSVRSILIGRRAPALSPNASTERP